MKRYLTWTTCATLALAACGGDGAGIDQNGSNGVGQNGTGQNGTGANGANDLIQTLDEGNGVFATQVNASDREAWVYFDLDAGVREEVTDPGASTTWDLAFRRSNIKVNGGHSGPADVAVAAIPEVPFADLSASPVALFEVDEPSVGEVDPDRPSFIDDDGTDFVFARANISSSNGWYNYDVINHVLSAADVTFIVRSSEGQHFKLRFLDYYNSEGSPGFPTFRWASVAPPPGPQTLSVDASGRDAFVYVALEDAQVVTVADPTTSTDWDLAFRRTLVRTNSGPSGRGWGGAREEGEVAFDALNQADTVGFRPDALMPPPGPPVPPEQWEPANETLSAWFNYDPVNHSVSPREAVFTVRDAEGGVHKLRVLSWEDGRYDLEVGPVPPKPDIRSITLDTPDTEWTYFDLRLGEVVEVDDAANSRAWDLAFLGDEVRLNGGASGPGEAAAAPVEGALEDIVRVPEEGFEADVDGSNPVLSAWTEDASTFVVKLADGTYGKLRVVRADGAQWELDYAYAGPGRRSFR